MDKEKLFAKFTPVELFQMSLISIGGMLILTLVTGIYLFFWSDFSLVLRWLALINSLFGVLFLFSMYVSTYQSYQMVKLANEGQGMMDILKGFGDTLITPASTISDYPDDKTERREKNDKEIKQ